MLTSQKGHVLKTRILSLLVLIASTAHTSDKKVDAAIEQRILQGLQQSRADARYGKIEKTPIPGIYKVKVADGPTLYVSADGQYLISGEMYALEPGRFVSLHEQDRLDKRAALLAATNLDEMIVYAPKTKPKAIIYVFTDVDCPYCVKLHNEIPKINEKGIEIRYLAYPRAGIYSPSYSKIATAWCSNNPKEWLPRLQRGEVVEIQDCENNPVAYHFELGNQIGVPGTPAIVLEDGRLFSGFHSADDIAKKLGIE